MKPRWWSLLLAISGALIAVDAAPVRGVARWVGPLSNCQAEVLSAGSVTQITTSSNGSFSFVPAAKTSLFKTTNLDSTCADTFGAVQAPFEMLALLPDFGASLPIVVSMATVAASAQLLPVEPLNWDTDPVTSALPPDPNTVSAEVMEKQVQQIYRSMGVDFAKSTVSQMASTLQPLEMMKSVMPSIRSAGTAALASEFQLGTMLGLGGVWLAATCKAANSSFNLPRQMAVSAVAATLSNRTAQGVAFMPDQGEWVRILFMDTAKRLLPANVLSASTLLEQMASSISNMAVEIANLIQNDLQAAVGGLLELSTDMDIFGAVVQMARLSVVLRQAEDTVQLAVSTGNPALLDSFSHSGIQIRLADADIDYAIILQSLGLPAPPPAESTEALALTVGPMAGCQVTSTNVFDTGYSNADIDRGGHFTIANRPTSWVSMYRMRGCNDTITTAPSYLAFSNLAVPEDEMVLNPIGVLAIGFYNYRSLKAVLTPSMDMQVAGYTAVGLDRAQYMNTINPTNVAYINMTAPPGVSVFTQAYMRQPYYIAGAAINGQLITVLLTAVAMYQKSCAELHGWKLEAGAEYAVRMVATGIAKESTASNASGQGMYFDLADRNKLLKAYHFAKQKCQLPSESRKAGRRLHTDLDAGLDPEQANSHGGRRLKEWYTNHSDFDSSMELLASMVSTINTHWFQAPKEAALAAAPGFNATDTLLTVTQAAYLVQTEFYKQTLLALEDQNRLQALAALQNEFNPTGLDRMVIDIMENENITNSVCLATGSKCSTLPEDDGGDEDDGGNIGAIVGIVVGIVAGVILLALGIYFLYRCNSERHTAAAVQQEYNQKKAEISGMHYSASHGHKNPIFTGGGAPYQGPAQKYAPQSYRNSTYSNPIYTDSMGGGSPFAAQYSNPYNEAQSAGQGMNGSIRAAHLPASHGFNSSLRSHQSVQSMNSSLCSQGGAANYSTSYPLHPARSQQLNASLGGYQGVVGSMYMPHTAAAPHPSNLAPLGAATSHYSSPLSPIRKPSGPLQTEMLSRSQSVNHPRSDMSAQEMYPGSASNSLSSNTELPPYRGGAHPSRFNNNNISL